MSDDQETDEDHPLKRGVGYLRQFSIRLGQALVAGRRADYDIGAMIDEAMRGRYWERWPNVEGVTPAFTVWCDQVLGFRERKALYMRANYRALRGLNLADDTLYRALRLGWTRLSLVLRAARSEQTLIQWLDRIESFKMNAEEIEAEVRQAQAAVEPAVESDESDADGSRHSTVEAGAQAPADPAGAGASDGAPPGADTNPPARRPKETIVFDDVEDLRIWAKVRALIKERFGVSGKGRALGILATEYLAALPNLAEGGVSTELAYVVQSVERAFGVRLAIIGEPPVHPTGVVSPRGASPLAESVDV